MLDSQHFLSTRSISSLPVRSGGKGVAGHSVLRSNSQRVRGVSHCREKLSQSQLGVLCRCSFSSFRRLATGGDKESVVGSASIYSFRSSPAGLNGSNKHHHRRFPNGKVSRGQRGYEGHIRSESEEGADRVAGQGA